MLVQRVLVAAVGLPLLAVMLFVPERAYTILLTALLAYGAFEFVRAAAPGVSHTWGSSAAAATALLVVGARTIDGFPLVWLIPAAIGAVGLLLWSWNALGDGVGGWWLGGILYVGVPGAYLVLTRNLVEGQAWLVVLLAIVFATDTGAYAVGRLLGRHKLAPEISPNKTVEGAIGGLLAGAAAAVLVPGLVQAGIAPLGLALLALLVPVAAMAGDLVESALKRRMGVKDMSHLLPGHGGLLDRLDSILVAGPCLYWIVRWLQT